MDETENAIKIAVVQEQISGLREQQKAHAEATKEQLASLGIKIDELTAIMNRGKGAFAASMALAGALGAAIVSLFGAVTDYFHR